MKFRKVLNTVEWSLYEGEGDSLLSFKITERKNDKSLLISGG